MLAQWNMGQLLQLFFVSGRTATGDRAWGGNIDYVIFHRLWLVLIHFNRRSLHIYLLQVSEISLEPEIFVL